MVLVLPDGDNGFYTDENEGKSLFPETKTGEAATASMKEKPIPILSFRSYI